MIEPKPFASLSSGLLARKGQAKPAMRPQGFGGFGMMGNVHEDLGWNDMGHGYDPNEEPNFTPTATSLSALTPGVEPEVFDEEFEEEDLPPQPLPQVLKQREALHEEFAPVAEPIAPEPVEQVTEFEAAPEAIEPVADCAHESEPVAAIEPTPQPEPARPLSPARVERIGREVAARKSKAAFTLRLDSERHLKLRLASAVTGRSSQMLVTEALDQFLESLPEVGELAHQLPARAGRAFG